MNKLIAATGFAAAFTVCAGTAALAADTMIQTDQVRANKIIGAAVYDRQNEDVASVKDLILDKTGKVTNVVLVYGATAGIGGKYIAVNFSNLKFDNNRLTLDQTKAQLDSMPPYKLEDDTSGSGKGAVPATGGHANSPHSP